MATIHDHFDGSAHCLECGGMCRLAGEDMALTQLVRNVLEYHAFNGDWIPGEQTGLPGFFMVCWLCVVRFSEAAPRHRPAGAREGEHGMSARRWLREFKLECKGVFTVLWLEDDKRLQVGKKLRLKDDDRWWTVVERYDLIPFRPKTDWKVGGLP